LLFDFTNGFLHDTGNAIATSIATGARTRRESRSRTPTYVLERSRKIVA
jgi:hypothetical protein